MKAAAFDYHRAEDTLDALAALGRYGGDAKLLAGGCSLGPMLNLRLARPAALVDLRRVAELRKLTQSADRLGIGAGWTHAEIEDGVVPDVTRGFMRKIAGGIAYRPIRNRGTIGGSLVHADPAADWVNAMIALDATILIRGPGGERRVPAQSFIAGAYTTQLKDNELVLAVEVPALSEAARWGWHKVCRKTGEFAMAIGAAIVDPPRGFARVVCGAIEKTPLVLPRASAALAQRAPDTAAVALAEMEALLGEQTHFFKQLHTVAVERAIAEALS